MQPAAPANLDHRHALDVVVTGSSSDAHTWNLVFLQLLLEDLGHRVVNLGPCAPDELVVSSCRVLTPDLLVVSSVNGHGYHDARSLLGALRADDDTAKLPVVVGGKLGIAPEGREEKVRALIEAGCDAVFDERVALTSFEAFVNALPKSGPSSASPRSVASPASIESSRAAAPSPAQEAVVGEVRR
ncbi:cobalamin B12-binding domain-containing protein [Streptomyces sp. NPDC017260]|uniref:cobalamin B12-binding domain-containing protein n=1 Tax=unclassified Streptomyces TaxID=2593676 RepID=UPI0037AAEEFA